MRTVVALTRGELAQKTRQDFDEDTAIRVGKYLIFVKGLSTWAESDDRPMVSLKSNEMPRYIREFVF
jgi:hypothetical protein